MCVYPKIENKLFLHPLDIYKNQSDNGPQNFFNKDFTGHILWSKLHDIDLILKFPVFRYLLEAKTLHASKKKTQIKLYDKTKIRNQVKSRESKNPCKNLWNKAKNFLKKKNVYH